MGSGMRIISSEVTEAIQQQDGRVSVTEQHLYDDGGLYLYPYFL
jgi:hypothetical protein